MTVENVKELVSAAMSEGETTPVESTPTPVVENVSSQEVKTEATPVIEAQVVETKPVVDERNDSQKDAREEQINNLNKALSIEREERKKLEAELGTVKPVFDKFKSAFAPDPEPVINEPVVEDEQSKFEQWYAQKEAAKQEEQNQTKLQEMIKTQIDTLSKEWN